MPCLILKLEINLGIMKGTDFQDFGIKHLIWYDFSNNWYMVRYEFSENWYKFVYAFSKNWYKERVCF